MKYRYRFLIYLILLIITLLVAYLIFYPKTSETGKQTYVSLNECVIYGTRMPYYPTVGTYGVLIDCLVDKESNGNPEAINPMDIDGKPKFGILQFGKETWKEWCVDTYMYRDDIMDEELQRDCCAEMLRDGQLWRWGTKDLCI